LLSLKIENVSENMILERAATGRHGGRAEQQAKKWTPGGNPAPKIGGKVGTHTMSKFPFLDMELSWRNDGNLKFGVHMKFDRTNNSSTSMQEAPTPQDASR